MNIYNRSSLVTFYHKHPDCKETLENLQIPLETLVKEY